MWMMGLSFWIIQIWLRFFICALVLNDSLAQESSSQTNAIQDNLQNMIWIDGQDDLPGFWIDQYEFPNQLSQLPLVGLNLEGAKTACASVNKDVCTAAQWRRACLGEQGINTYGYGPNFQKGWCAQFPNRKATHTSLLYEANEYSPSGLFQNCRTPEGVVDMIGNVEEWVLDDWMGIGGMLEGGANYTHISYATCLGTYSRMPDYRLQASQQVSSAGVRCCLNVEPLTEAIISHDRQQRLPQKKVIDRYGTNEIQIAQNLWIDQYEYPNIPGQDALVGVTWEEANRLCQNQQKRLCTVSEWERACVGSNGSQYSYGNWYVKGLCGIEALSSSAIGFYELCKNDLGVHDLIGGVWEWTATPFDSSVLGDQVHEIRGGSWMVEPQKGMCRPWDGYPATQNHGRFEDLGFRCCRGEDSDKGADLAWSGFLECPDGMINIGDFCIDLMEFPNQKDRMPQKMQTWQEAQAHCQSKGKNVCSDIQWSMACEGPSHRGYPYGHQYESMRCALNDMGGVGRVYPSGSFERCRTPEGILDMSGNLWEWVAISDDSTKDQGGMLRGGGSQLSAGLGRCRTRSMVEQSSQAGVRCCLDLSMP